MCDVQAVIAEATPDARLATLPGQTHMVKAKVLPPIVMSFLS